MGAKNATTTRSNMQARKCDQNFGQKAVISSKILSTLEFKKFRAFLVMFGFVTWPPLQKDDLVTTRQWFQIYK